MLNRFANDMYPDGDVPPYPVDDAAMHHVFDGGWIWILPFNNGITSAGVAAKTSFADDLKFSEGEPAWQRLLERFPTIKRQFARAKKTFFLSFIIGNFHFAQKLRLEKIGQCFHLPQDSLILCSQPDFH